MNSPPTPSAFMRDDRREFNRKKLQAELGIEWGSGTLTAAVRDIGPHGLFIELAPPLWVGAKFHGRLMVNPVVRLDCTVRRVEPGGGIAVSFEFEEENGRAQLAALLNALPNV